MQSSTCTAGQNPIPETEGLFSRTVPENAESKHTKDLSCYLSPPPSEDSCVSNEVRDCPIRISEFVDEGFQCSSQICKSRCELPADSTKYDEPPGCYMIPPSQACTSIFLQVMWTMMSSPSLKSGQTRSYGPSELQSPRKLAEHLRAALSLNIGMQVYLVAW